MAASDIGAETGIRALDRDLDRLLARGSCASELLDHARALRDPRRVIEEIASTIRSELEFERVAVWKWDAASRSFIGVHAAGLSPRLVRSLRIPFRSVVPLAATVIHEGGRRLLQTSLDHDGTEGLAREIYSALGETPGSCLFAPLQSSGRGRCFRLRGDPAGCRKAEAGAFAGLDVRMTDREIESSCRVCPAFPLAGFLWADGGGPGRLAEQALLGLGLTLAKADLLLEAATLLESLGSEAAEARPEHVSDAARFQRVLAGEIERAGRFGHSVALVLIGLEENGAEGPDQCVGREGRIARIAESLVSTVRRLDRIGRTGPDEMAFVLPRVDAGEATAAVERLRGHLLEGGEPGVAPVPAGIAVALQDARDAEELLGFARYALHRARAAGAGRTQVFGRGALPEPGS
jgi:GGDEF domain-containing protein